MPVGARLRPQAALQAVADDSRRGLHRGAAHIAVPSSSIAVVVNLAIGLVNRLTPQIPVYFISGPFVIAGGVILFYFISGSMVTAFMSANSAIGRCEAIDA